MLLINEYHYHCRSILGIYLSGGNEDQGWQNFSTSYIAFLALGVFTAPGVYYEQWAILKIISQTVFNRM